MRIARSSCCSSTPGLEPELVVQAVPGLPVDLEPVGLPAAPVEREHQLRPEALAERVLGAERLELGDERQVAAERELGVDALLDRGEAELVEPLGLDPVRAARARDPRAAVHATTPPPRAASGRRDSASPGRERLTALLDQQLEPLEIELARLDPEQVAARPRGKARLARRRRAQNLPQP